MYDPLAYLTPRVAPAFEFTPYGTASTNPGH
jgi:hypothetical protein